MGTLGGMEKIRFSRTLEPREHRGSSKGGYWRNKVILLKFLLWDFELLERRKGTHAQASPAYTSARGVGDTLYASLMGESPLKRGKKTSYEGGENGGVLIGKHCTKKPQSPSPVTHQTKKQKKKKPKAWGGKVASLRKSVC